MIDKNLPLAVIDFSNADYNFIDSDIKIRDDFFKAARSLKKKHGNFNLVVLLGTQEKVNNIRIKEIVIPAIETIFRYLKIYKFVFIVNSWQRDEYLADNPGIIFSDTWAIRSDFSFKKNNNHFNKTWNHSSSNVLFFLGKPNRIHRIGLLHKLMQDQEIKINLLYSLFLNDFYKKNCQQFIIDSNISNDEYQNFITVSEKKLDTIISIDRGNEFNFDSFSFDSSLYANSIVSLISESEFSPYKEEDYCRGKLIQDPFIQITEKTWKTICNFHPFIGAGRTDYLSTLSEMGFKTFEEYMEVKDYSRIPDDKERILAIVENVKYFSKFVNGNPSVVDKINKDIAHNFDWFNRYVTKEKQFLMEELGTNNLHEVSKIILQQ